MDKQEAINILDEMIEAIPEHNKDIKSFTCCTEIYTALDLKEYKGFKIYGHKLMPKDYACSGSLYF